MVPHVARPVVAGPHEERLTPQRSRSEIDGLYQQVLALELEIRCIAVRTVDVQDVDILVEFSNVGLFCIDREVENIQEIGVARLFFSDVSEDILLLGKARVLE